MDQGGPPGMSRATIYRKTHEYGIYTSVEPSVLWNASRRPSSCGGGGSGGRAPVVSV
jgi:hypothetical protein